MADAAIATTGRTNRGVIAAFRRFASACALFALMVAGLVSMNHALGEMNYLNDIHLRSADHRYIDLAEAIRGGIDDTALAGSARTMTCYSSATSTGRSAGLTIHT